MDIFLINLKQKFPGEEVKIKNFTKIPNELPVKDLFYFLRASNDFLSFQIKWISTFKYPCIYRYVLI